MSTTCMPGAQVSEPDDSAMSSSIAIHTNKCINQGRKKGGLG